MRVSVVSSGATLCGFTDSFFVEKVTDGVIKVGDLSKMPLLIVAIVENLLQGYSRY